MWKFFGKDERVPPREGREEENTSRKSCELGTQPLRQVAHENQMVEESNQGESAIIEEGENEDRDHRGNYRIGRMKMAEERASDKRKR